MDLSTLVDSKTFIGILSGIGGAILTGALAILRGRVRVLEYRRSFTRVGISAQDAVLGDVSLLWQGQQVPNLFLYELRLKNTTYSNFEKLKFKAYTGKPTFLLNEQTRIEGTTSIVPHTADFARFMDVASGATPTDLQQDIYWHRREYEVSILNRNQEIVLNYLTVVPDGGEPVVYIDLQHLGATAEFEPQRPEIHGVPVAWAAPLGLAATVATVVGVSQVDGLGVVGPILCAVVGLTAQSVGALLYRVGRVIYSTILR